MFLFETFIDLDWKVRISTSIYLKKIRSYELITTSVLLYITLIIIQKDVKRLLQKDLHWSWPCQEYNYHCSDSVLFHHWVFCYQIRDVQRNILLSTSHMWKMLQGLQPLKNSRYLGTLMYYLVISDPLELFAIQFWTDWNYPFQKTTINNYIILYTVLANNEGIWFANLSFVSEL